jgi:excisionase family DNA binding protein
MEKPFYRVKDIARMLEVKPKSVYNLIYSGKLPARKWGGSWIVLKEDFERYLKELPMAGKKFGG